MIRRLTMRVVPSAVSMARAIRVAAAGAPMLVLTGRALGDLSRELGGMDAAAEYLLELAEEVGKPVGINVQTGPDTSRTAFIGPRSWSEERLQGCVAAKHEELAAQFGEVTRVGAGSGS